jgi:hypothetical protein
MGQTSTVSAVQTMSAFQLKVSARGALIRAFAGSTFMYLAVVFSGHRSPLWFSIVAVPSVGLIAWAVLRVRATRRLPSSASDLDHWKSIRKFYWLDVGLEWGLVAVAMFALAHLNRFDLAPQALGVIIGLHYLPLGTFLRGQQYYWTGGVMIAAAVGSLPIRRGNIRNIVGCSALGLTLWVTCVAILCWTSSAAGDQAKSKLR